MSSSRLCRFAMAETVLHQSAQFGFLDVSAGHILGLAFRVFFWAGPLPEF